MSRGKTRKKIPAFYGKEFARQHNPERLEKKRNRDEEERSAFVNRFYETLSGILMNEFEVTEQDMDAFGRDMDFVSQKVVEDPMSLLKATSGIFPEEFRMPVTIYPKKARDWERIAREREYGERMARIASVSMRRALKYDAVMIAKALERVKDQFKEG